MSHNATLRLCLVILTIIALFAALRYGQDVFAPLVSAIVLGVVLSPLSNFWERLGLRRSVATFITVIIALGAIIVVAFLLEPYVTKAINRAPVIMSEMRATAQEVQQMLRGIDEIGENVAEAMTPDADPALPMPEGADVIITEKADDAVIVPTATDALLWAPHYLAKLLIFVGAFYFFLLSRAAVYAGMGALLGGLTDDHLRHAEAQVSRYMLTISAINASFGVIVAITMQLLGMPSPVLWGMLAFLVNYLLYLGPIALGTTLLIAGHVVFDGPMSFAPALLYQGMNAIEGQFVTPSLVGRSMQVNPLLVFTSLVFWMWMWGAIGAIIAIPILIWVGVVARGMIGQDVDDVAEDTEDVTADQTISSGTPGKLRPNRLAGADT